MTKYYQVCFFFSLHTWRVRLSLIHSSGGRWVCRGERVSSAAVSLSGWCPPGAVSHMQVTLVMWWSLTDQLEISVCQRILSLKQVWWQRVIWEFDAVYWMCHVDNKGKMLGSCYFPASPQRPWPNHSLQTCTERHKERVRQREREWKRGLYRVTILDSFQGFCQSLWRFGK